jgi:tetratricopeptide (TPR) repeat protein
MKTGFQIALFLMGICSFGSSPCFAQYGTPVFERNWVICDLQTKPIGMPEERLRACNYVISAGPGGGGSKIVGGNTTRGEELYVGAYQDRAIAYTDLYQFQAALQDLDFFLGKADRIQGLKQILGFGYGRRALAYYYMQDYDRSLADLDQEDAWFRKLGFGGGGPTGMLRGDIDMARGRYQDALDKYEHIQADAAQNNQPQYPELAGKISRAQQLLAAPQTPAPQPVPHGPATPDNPNPACKLYPNLC